MPGGKQVVVDAKVPLAAYLEAFETSDEEERAARLAGARPPGARPCDEARGQGVLAPVHADTRTSS